MTDMETIYHKPNLLDQYNKNKTNNAIRNRFYEFELVNYIGIKTQPIIRRLALIYYSLIIFSKTPNEEVVNNYLRSNHAFKQFANNLVPGEIFKDNMISTSRIFPMAYRDVSLDGINSGYMSEPWTIFGLAWILCNYWSVILLFIFGFVVQAVLSFFSRLSSYSFFILGVLY